METGDNELLFLGTGAADWSQPDKAGYFRRSAAALLNGELLFDCGPGIWDFEKTSPGVLDGVTDVLLTHDHEDHFDPTALRRLADRRRLRLACDGFAWSLVGPHPHIERVPVTPGVSFRLGAYAVTPVAANHDVVRYGIRQACHYIVRTPDGKTVFYGLDGAWFLRPAWVEMQKHKYDVMVLDCTVGDRDDWRVFEHNSIPMLRILVRQIEEQKLLTKTGCIVASHFSRALHPAPAETERTLQTLHVRAAFDGMHLVF